MIKLLIEKELRDLIGTTKFVTSFAVCSILILLAFYAGARHYQISQSRYEAAVQGNLRQMEGLTEWLRVDHHIYLPPDPVSALVTGVANDIGQNIEVAGRGELTAEDSRFNEDPVFAIFRFLDLTFIFQIVLSLFAILLAHDAINGEKENGTLRLTFANPVPRHQYILGKIGGAFLALGLPLLIPILLGALLLIVMGIPMKGDDWMQLTLVVGTGLLYFMAFLAISLMVSAWTYRSSTAFLFLLIIWISSALILPRSAVLLAGRAVDVLSIDQISAEKSSLRRQLWEEDKRAMNSYQPTSTEDMEATMKEFNQFMTSLGEERDKKMQSLSGRLNETRYNQQRQQEQLAFSLARLSPAGAFSLAASELAGTSIRLKQHYLDQATSYQKIYAEFMSQKTDGILKGSGMVMIMRRSGGDEAAPPPIDPHQIPQFQYRKPPLAASVQHASTGILILALYILGGFAAAFYRFRKYDVR